MGKGDKSEAYDLTQFEEYQSPKAAMAGKRSKAKAQKNKVISIENRDNVHSLRRKRNPIKITVVAVMTIIIACMLLTIVQCGVALNELNRQIQTEKQTISEQESLELQLQLQIDSKLPHSTVQKYAEEKLGMTKAKNAQKKFISLSEGNKGVVIEDDNSKNVLNTMLDAFKEIVS